VFPCLYNQQEIGGKTLRCVKHLHCRLLKLGEKPSLGGELDCQIGLENFDEKCNPMTIGIRVWLVLRFSVPRSYANGNNSRETDASGKSYWSYCKGRRSLHQ
jgi:hypothetical protein